MQLELAPERLSKEARHLVYTQIEAHPHDITASVLTTLHSLGFNVLVARNTSAEIRAAAVSIAQARLEHASSEVTRWQALSPITQLASNPTLDDNTFQFLAENGDDQVITRLISNESSGERRLDLLRGIIQKRMTEANPSNDDERWHINELREQLKHLDQWQRKRQEKSKNKSQEKQ